MPEYSIITCVSKPEIYQSCLLNSINSIRGNHDIEIIPIINTNNAYSASTALNLGIDCSKSEYLIFVHQDVKLLDNWFELLNQAILKADDWSVIGSAGIGLEYTYNDVGKWGGSKIDKSIAVGTVYDSDESTTPYWNGSKQLQKVHCVDECLFIVKKSTGLRFDSRFNGFHLYGVDMCLQARSAGYNVYSCHLPIIHYGQYSSSIISGNKYWTFLRLLYNKWRLMFPEMLGTHMHWVPNGDGKNELVSYIPYNISNQRGVTMKIQATGIERAKLSTDKKQFIQD